jgi:hypothetical protein
MVYFISIQQVVMYERSCSQMFSWYYDEIRIQYNDIISQPTSLVKSYWTFNEYIFTSNYLYSDDLCYCYPVIFSVNRCEVALKFFRQSVIPVIRRNCDNVTLSDMLSPEIMAVLQFFLGTKNLNLVAPTMSLNNISSLNIRIRYVHTSDSRKLSVSVNVRTRFGWG